MRSHEQRWVPWAGWTSSASYSVDADFKERDGAPGVMDVDLLGDGKSPEQTYAPVRSPHSAAERSHVRVWW
jgi:hypothetical protein